MYQITLTFETAEQGELFMKAFEAYNTEESNAIDAILEYAHIGAVHTIASEGVINLS